MKKFKTGFSLAEVLIALAIVSVIATMGFSIAKRGIERSYDMYIYTGYKSLVDAIAYVNTKGINANENQSEFFSELTKVLDAKYSVNSGAKILKNKNGVEYQFRGGSSSGHYRSFDIHFIVPTSAFNESGTTQNRISFLLKYYYTPDNLNIVLPQIGQVYYPTGDVSFGIAHSISKDISTRKDLLPAYIDDGVVGRSIGGSFNPKTYYSLKEAYCKSTLQFTKEDGSKEKLPAGAFPWNCSDVSNTNSIEGTLQLENPRKLSAF